MLLELFLIFSLKQTLTNTFFRRNHSRVVFSELFILCKNGCKDEISLLQKPFFGGKKLRRERKSTKSDVIIE